MQAIAAMSENRAIGKNGSIPWRVPQDFKWFKEFTMGKTLVVGKNTFDTLPFLKNRECLVIIKQHPDLSIIKNQYIINESGMTGKLVSYDEVVSSQNKDLIIAGGAKTYELLLPHITEFYVTHIKGIYDADTYMSPFEHLFVKQETVKEFDDHKVIKYSR